MEPLADLWLTLKISLVDISQILIPLIIADYHFV